jgi:hypothetical protein
MPRRTLHLAILVAFCIGPAFLSAQDFTLLGHEVQVHGFASQAFVKTDVNNWLTMDTSDGSAGFTDFGVSLSTHMTAKLFVGGQLYDRNLGQLGQYHPSLDWAVADYRFKNWFGVRGGKVKTTLGLYNATQDQDFLRVFALLPQSIYPTDLRDSTIAHVGGDVYGNIFLKRDFGELSYTAFVGHRSDSIYSGYPYWLSGFGARITSYGGLQYGADLRWKTPLKGLLIGASRLDEDITGRGLGINPFNFAAGLVPYTESSKADWTNQFYGEYTTGKLHIDSEYRRYWRNQELFGGISESFADVRGWYVSGAYRVLKRLQIGSYYSHYTITNVVAGAFAALYPPATDTGLPADHDYDKVIAARVDLNKFWNVKIEGHFMNGYGSGPYPNGFYTQENPQGFKPDTNALIIRTSVYF